MNELPSLPGHSSSLTAGLDRTRCAAVALAPGGAGLLRRQGRGARERSGAPLRAGCGVRTKSASCRPRNQPATNCRPEKGPDHPCGGEEGCGEGGGAVETSSSAPLDHPQRPAPWALEGTPRFCPFALVLETATPLPPHAHRHQSPKDSHQSFFFGRGDPPLEHAARPAKGPVIRFWGDAPGCWRGEGDRVSWGPRASALEGGGHPPLSPHPRDDNVPILRLVGGPLALGREPPQPFLQVGGCPSPALAACCCCPVVGPDDAGHKIIIGLHGWSWSSRTTGPTALGSVVRVAVDGCHSAWGPRLLFVRTGTTIWRDGRGPGQATCAASH